MLLPDDPVSQEQPRNWFADDFYMPVLSRSDPSDLASGMLSVLLLCLFVYCLSLHNNGHGVNLRANYAALLVLVSSSLQAVGTFSIA